MILLLLAAPAATISWADAPDLPAVAPNINHAADQPVHLRIDHDNTVITQSCIIDPGAYTVSDADGNGVVHVEADGITVEFARGAVLNGVTAADQWPDTFDGMGIRIDGRTDVILKNVTLSGFKVGISAAKADHLTVDGADIHDMMRTHLRSTPEAEDGSDWLFPHANDNDEWMTQHGAAIWIKNSDNIDIHDVTVRRSQNGILISRVNHSKIYDNDASFLSGWGLGMWRSSDNVISRNAFDFCARGYSDGIYNRGQDSAGILMFEQCSHNTLAENSATHGGDCFFGFAGQEALGQKPAPSPEFDYQGRGNNDNLLINNDFSYGVAHGIEMTFSFGNRFIGNRLVDNSICGIWGGYCQNTLIAGNDIQSNGEMGYGEQRGGINIEHGVGNRIEWNRFRNNKCGIFLWWDADTDLMKSPWGQANNPLSRDNSIIHNTFDGDDLVLELRDTTGTVYEANHVTDVKREFDLDDKSKLITDMMLPAVMFTPPTYEAYGDKHPVGARTNLNGRENIIMTAWQPWDHAAPMVRLLSSRADRVVYEAYGQELHASTTMPELVKIQTSHAPSAIVSTANMSHETVTFEMRRPGIGTFSLSGMLNGVPWKKNGSLMGTNWNVTLFHWDKEKTDPRTNYEGWLALSKGQDALHRVTHAVMFNFNGGGPGNIADLHPDDDLRALGNDYFGDIETTTTDLPAGKWKITTRSDDGIRVTIRSDETGEKRIIDNWTWHGPTQDTGEFTLTKQQPVEIRIEHFEIDGWSVNTFDITREE